MPPGRRNFSLKSVRIPAKKLLANGPKFLAAGHIANFQTSPRPRRLSGQMSIANVPATINTSPRPERRVSRSRNTKRQEVKELIRTLDKKYPGLKSRVFGAMQGLPLPAWGPVEHRRVPLPDGE